MTNKQDNKFLTDHSVNEIPYSENIPSENDIIVFAGGKPYKLKSIDLKKAQSAIAMLNQINEGDFILKDDIQFVLPPGVNHEGFIATISKDGVATRWFKYNGVFSNQNKIKISEIESAVPAISRKNRFYVYDDNSRVFAVTVAPNGDYMFVKLKKAN